ncbi:hypothetical protein FE783_28735 [Paenibacillus mesophilus]|uniref:hypothetical protein n=1 Tax=Paenibacillus mesophilus TaxID=2582849 RepID=UPI00110F4FE5|nr:hypothetical protein [Paenibacillus mesophilus]TMV45671.1 hypothetical protein FE783_28735 [Paenibacillus mesophilus]
MIIRKLTAVLLAFWIAAFASAAANAASYELSASQKTAFDKLAGSDPRLDAQYAELIGLQQQDKDWEVWTKAAGSRNDEALSDLRRDVAAIDSALLDKLKAEMEQTKERYKPILDSYTALNKQISAAKSLPGKELTSFLRMRADSMKILVQLAKLEIKAKEAAYRTAKDSATAKQKKVRAAMADIDPLEAAIKAEKSSTGAVKKRFADNWKAFTPLVKKGEAHSLSATLDNLLADFRLVVVHKQNLYNLEIQISGAIETAKAQLPDQG